MVREIGRYAISSYTVPSHLQPFIANPSFPNRCAVGVNSLRSECHFVGVSETSYICALPSVNQYLLLFMSVKSAAIRLQQGGVVMHKSQFPEACDRAL